ncbi:dephospho-CoA kinase [Psychrosphaera haliotis]|uniref:dephospho-CoA kinase n=1 Tax=Psychrosphaera haliotis TaxID=555083 RepID=UPI0031D35473
MLDNALETEFSDLLFYIKDKLIIGLTGGIGSGKTAASDHFMKLGVDIVDADVIAREIVKPNSKTLSKVAEQFGADILLENGELNRAKLRERIFTNDDDKQALNSIMQPAIRYALLEQLNKARSEYVILSAPLLLENGLEKYCQRVLVVDVPVETQLQRASSRDTVSSNQIQSIIDSQIDRTSRLSKADDVIDNSADLTHLYKQVTQLHNKYLTLAVG